MYYITIIFVLYVLIPIIYDLYMNHAAKKFAEQLFEYPLPEDTYKLSESYNHWRYGKYENDRFEHRRYMVPKKYMASIIIKSKLTEKELMSYYCSAMFKKVHRSHSKGVSVSVEKPNCIGLAINSENYISVCEYEIDLPDIYCVSIEDDGYISLYNIGGEYKTRHRFFNINSQ